MRRTPRKTMLCVLALAGAGSTPARATDEAFHELAPQRFDRVTVISGGVTLDEAAAVKRLAARYPLRVVLSGRGGDYYIADHLSVLQRGQLVAELTDAGPWLLMDLPPGRYTLLGRFSGLTMSRDVTVSGAGTTLHWVVPPTLN